jgi:hypothetical protein
VNLNSIFFLNEGKGYGVGNAGHILEFSGKDFLEVLPSGTTLPLDQVLFISDSIGIITGGYRDWEGDHGSIMLRTTDGGSTWIEVPDMPYWIHDVCFSDSLNGVAVGEEFGEGRGVILETADAGENWDVETDTLPGPLRALDFEEGIWWAIGDNSLILKNGTPSTSNNEFWTNQNEIPFYSYPNPFWNKTVIRYQLQSPTEIELCIYDISGRKVSILLNENQPSGTHEVTWNVPEMDPGIYFCELRTRYNRQVIKMILTR